MPYQETVEEARERVEEIMLNVELDLDSMRDQDNAECEEEIMAEHPDFQHLDPGHITDERPTNSNIYAKVELPPDK